MLPRPRPVARRLLAGALAVGVVAGLLGCERAGTDGADAGEPRSPSASVPATPTAPTASPSADTGCPASYVEPDPDRPEITLTFDLSADRRTVVGTERVVFRPDRPVTELVFRLWPNQLSAPASGSLQVTRASAEESNGFRAESLGARAGTQGTLVTVPLPGTVQPGRSVTAELEFTLRLPGPEFERWGSDGATAWWGTGHPLLAWERGAGWQREPGIAIAGEAAVSETARYDVTVTAPAVDTVLMGGVAETPEPAGEGRRRWRATADAARDVAVSVGPFVTRSTTVAGTTVTVGAPPASAGRVDALLGETVRAVRLLAARFGPFPYPALAASVLPSIGGSGIEFPGAIQLGPEFGRLVVTHEVAHQWFYGLVGGNQGRDPWLDEAFATYAEALTNGSGGQYAAALRLPERVDTSMAEWGGRQRPYASTVYGKGAAALLRAREQAGPSAFDRAVRCYVAATAWQVGTAADVERALAALPRATAVLQAAGALE